jgi:tRNA/tmRNA/rRNA uracil-C5-methylase (TrmA/RlmC/RlmD family)
MQNLQKATDITILVRYRADTIMSYRGPNVEEHEIHTAVDLFCGSGAVTAGLRKQGFDVVAAGRSA